MHPVVFEIMIKERIKDLTAEIERGRMITLAQKKNEENERCFTRKKPVPEKKGSAMIRILARPSSRFFFKILKN